MPQALRRKKKRRFRFLRRLLFVAVVFMLLYGIFRLGVFGYRSIFVPPVRYAIAQAVEQPLYTGKAVILRDDFPIAAPKGGIVNLLLPEQTQVQSGQSILEIVDQTLLSAIDKQLADEAAELVGVSSQTNDAISFKQSQLATALNDIRDLSQSYAELLGRKETEGATRVYNELVAAHKNAAEIQQQYDYVTRSQEQYDLRRQDLLEQRSQAISLVTSPLQGIVRFQLDGWEAQLKPAKTTEVTLAILRQIKGEQRAVVNGDRVAAGQAVAVICEENAVILMFETKSLLVAPGSVDVVFSEQVLPVHALSKQPTGEEGVSIVAMEIQNPPASLLTGRVVEITVQARGVALVSIPASALVTSGDKVNVYVKTATGEHVLTEVVVSQTLGKSVVVLGLKSGDTVITTPSRIEDEGGPQ